MNNGIQKVYRLDNQPFAQIPRDAIRDPKMTANGFRLLAYLMSHENGYELTYGQIERQTGLGRFAINGAIDNLSELGWAKVSSTKLPNGQFGPKAWYVMTPDTSATVGNSTAGNSTVEQPTDLKNKKIENKTKENNYPQAKLEEAFDSFWAVYPRKVEKLAGMKAFVKATNIVSPQVIIDGAHRLAQDPNLPPKQFVPYPASWLNAGGWDSEPYPERQLTKEEKEAKAEAEKLYRAEQAKLAREREQADREAERLEREARLAANPVTRCEHDRVKAVCPKCNTPKR
jgi:predicted transcriptional regulator